MSASAAPDLHAAVQVFNRFNVDENYIAFMITVKGPPARRISGDSLIADPKLRETG